MPAGGHTAGKDNLIRPGVDERRADIASPLKELHHIRREAGLSEASGYQIAAGGREIRGLEDDGVTGDDGGQDLRGGNGDGVVPWSEDADDATWLVAQAAAFGLNSQMLVRDALFTEKLGGIGGEIFGCIEGDHQVGKESLDLEFSGFANEQVGTLLAVGVEGVPKPPDQAAARCDGQRGPGALRMASAIKDGWEATWSCGCETGHDFASSRILGFHSGEIGSGGGHEGILLEIS